MNAEQLVPIAFICMIASFSGCEIATRNIESQERIAKEQEYTKQVEAAAGCKKPIEQEYQP